MGCCEACANSSDETGPLVPLNIGFFHVTPDDVERIGLSPGYYFFADRVDASDVQETLTDLVPLFADILHELQLPSVEGFEKAEYLEESRMLVVRAVFTPQEAE